MRYPNAVATYTEALPERITLFFATRRARRLAGIQRSLFRCALKKHREYILALVLGKPGFAAQLYDQMCENFPDDVIDLARCASLIEYGIWRGSLQARDFDTLDQLCGRIAGGPRLRALLDSIEKADDP